MRALVTLTALLVLAAPARAAAVPCGPADAPTMASGSLSRVYVHHGRYVVCTRGHAPAPFWRLSEVKPSFRVRGRWVGTLGGTLTPFLIDARDARFRVPTPWTYRWGETMETRTWVMTPGGGLVVGGAYTPDPPVDYPVRPTGGEIRRATGCGTEVLDAGPDVDPASLHVDGGTIRWQHAGAERSAPACPSGTISRRVCAIGPNESVVGLNRWGAMVEAYSERNDDYVRTDLCTRRGRRRIATTEDRSFNGSGVISLTTAGPWFAWSDEICWKDCSGGVVTAINARTGERRRIRESFETTQVAVNRDGILAMATASYDDPGYPDSVYVWTPRGSVLVAEEEVDRFSLRVTATAVRWRSRGAERSAPL